MGFQQKSVLCFDKHDSFKDLSLESRGWDEQKQRFNNQLPKLDFPSAINIAFVWTSDWKDVTRESFN